MLVTDASAWLGNVFPEQDARYPRAVARAVAAGGAAVPWIFWFEVRHVLLMGERRERFTAAASEEFLADLSSLGLAFDLHPGERVVLGLVRRHRLSVYDAAYLELAVRTGSTLASLDGDLKKAALAEGVPLFAAPA